MENNYSKRLSSLSLDGGQRVISYSKGDGDDHKDSLSVYSDIGAEMDYRRYTLPSDMPTKMPSWMSSYNIPTPSASRSNSKSSKSSRSSIISEDSMTPISPISYTPPPSIHSPHSSSVSSSSHQRSSSLANVPHINHPPPRTTSLNYNNYTDKTNDYNNAVNRSQSDPLHNKKNKTLLPMITRIKSTAEAHFGKTKYKPLDPPEPPKQLLIPSLCIEEEHHDNYALSSPAACLQQQYKEKDNDNDDDDDDREEKTINKNVSSSTLKISTLALSTDNNNNNNNGGYTLRRRSSCPPKPIDQLKKGNETDSPSSPTPSTSSTCSLVSSLQQKRKKHRESYHSSSTTTSFTSSRPPSALAMDMMWTSSSLPDQKPHPCDVYDHNKNIVLSFSKMNPRSVPLKRRTCGKHEKKALTIWHDSLVDLLKKEEHTKHNISNINHMTPDKREKYALTRKFILREIYLTEVTFWNQLYYTKVMFHDIMKTGIQRNSPFIRESDLDLMSNLPDLMQCSSKLIRKITPYLENPTCPETTKSYFNDQDMLNGGNDSHNNSSNSKRDSNISQYSTTSTLSDYSTTSSPLSPTSTHSSTSSSKESSSSSLLPLHLNADARYLPVPSDRTLIGKHICDMAESFVVYLRCALDYKHNRKKVDNRLQHNKGFMHYQEQLAKSKETNQFFVTDYFIIPIQRITRYGLLLADLEKHTSHDHPDFRFIRRARLIMTSLAVAMNKAQK